MKLSTLKRIQSQLPLAGVLSLVFVGFISAADGSEPKIVAGFGSSVCDGQGDHFDQGGYIGRLTTRLAKDGWEVHDVSRGGDNTITIQDRWLDGDTPPSRPVAPDRYLLQHNPDYVLIGLSLGNEGIMTDTDAKREAVINRFRTGLKDIIERCRAEGMRPVVANCYAHTHFGPKEYAATKRMNVLINGWDVPSINMLGAVDDGQGRWTEGFDRDPAHPAGGGHEEMYHAIVPTLFQAMEAGKPIPHRTTDQGYAHLAASDSPALSFTPADPIHAFTQVVSFRGEADGPIATILGKQSTLKTTTESFGQASRIIKTDNPFKATIQINNGQLEYQSTDSKTLRSTNPVNDGKWHQLVISHRAARGQTLLFIDGQLIDTIDQRLIPESFQLGGGPACDLREWFVYRSALNDYEVAELNDGRMIQSSLELYAPLNDKQFITDQPIHNLAQSLSEAIVKSEDIEAGTK